MGTFTFIPVWIILDILIFLVALFTVIFIIRKEGHPENILLEMLCFCVLYAAVYENFATIMGWYGYGKSLIMIGNVPLSVPVIEYLIVYATLRMLDHMDIPTWTKPFIAGLSGMLLDFSLDPLAIKLVFSTNEGLMGRWTWFPGPSDVRIYGEPVYNFSGWVLICGYAAAFILLGRWWFEKSGRRRAVGYLYPVLAMIASLAVLVSPLSRFLLWLEPVFGKGGMGEWLMLGFHLAFSAFILTVLWRCRMKRMFSFRENIPLILIFFGFPLSNIICTLLFGFLDILWLVLAATAIQWAIVAVVYFSGGRTAAGAEKRQKIP